MCIAWLGTLQGCEYDDGILWVVLIIFPIFFAFWNTGCSQLIIVPMLRWYWFGFHDQMANNAIKGAICPHWIIGIVVPTIMAGLPGFIFAVVIPYSYCIYKFNKCWPTTNLWGIFIRTKWCILFWKHSYFPKWNDASCLHTLPRWTITIWITFTWR